MTTGSSRDLTDRQARWALVGLIFLSTVGFSVLAWARNSSFANYGQDTAQFAYAFFQTLRGHWLHSFAGDYTLWGAHPNFLLLLWLPVFWLAPSVNTLFVVQSLTISLAAWPAYLLVRHVTGNRLTALIGAAALLLFPPIARVHVAELHDDPLGLVPLLFAIYFFEKGRFKWFAVFLGVTLLAKETIVLNTVLFSVYALWRRRSWWWVAFPAAWSIGYFLLVRYVVMPAFGDWWAGQLYSQTKYFSQWGNGPGEVLRNMGTHPGAVMGTMFGADRLGYLFKLLLPVGLILPFGSGLWVTAAPSLGVNLLSNWPFLREFTHWYGMLPGAQLWASMILALPLWSQQVARWFGGRDYSRSLCVVVLLLCVAQYNLWLTPSEYRRNPSHAAQVDAIAAVPGGSSVLCADHILPAFANRPAINSLVALNFHHQDLNRVFDYEYIVFDGNYPGLPGEAQMQQALFKVISQNPAYQSVFARENVFVFQRVGVPERTLRW